MGRDRQSSLLRDTGDVLVARYTYAPGYADEVAVSERDLNPACERSEQTGREPTGRVPKGCDAEGAHNADDDPPAPRLRRASFADANEVVYYHQNTLFSVYAVSDASQSVVERYRYDAYGGCGVRDADGTADADGLSDVQNPYLFTGRRLDPECGLMQYRFRAYDSGLGRFFSRDPAGYVDEMSLYEYVSGRPAHLADPLGKWGYKTHYTLTRTLAGEAGLSEQCALAMAMGNQGIDDAYPAIKAYREEYVHRRMPEEERRELVFQTILWPFPRGASNQKAVEGGSTASEWLIKRLEEAGECSCYGFGMALHPYQDSWAHAGMPPLGRTVRNAYGHSWKRGARWQFWPAWMSHDADKPNLRETEYKDMEQSTKEQMVRFLERCECHAEASPPA